MIKWFANHPTASNLLLILMIAIGLFSAPKLKRETFPDYRPVEVSIEVVYRGASAADVEDAICRKVQDVLKGVDFLDESTCTAQDNIAKTVAKMLPDGDPIRFLSDIDTEVRAISDMPAQSEEPIIRELHRSDLVAAVAVSGDLPVIQLENYALRLEDRLMSLPGVASVSIHGISQRQWQIEIPRGVLAQYNLTVKSLSRLLARQSIDMPLGTLETQNSDIQLRFTEQRKSLRELKNLVVVSSPDRGGEVTLGEIAKLTETGEKPETKVLVNGQRAVVLEVSKSLRDDALDVMAELSDMVENEHKRLDGIQLSITQDMTSIVRDRLRMLIENGIMGLILVVLVMSLFFKPRLAIWAVLGLPSAFMGAFFVMSMTGLTLNMITLVALLMSIGIVMDDAIVITDNIVSGRDEKLTPAEIVAKGATQVFPGVMSSFLTTISVFLPLSFLAGELGAVLEVLPVVLLAALSASLIEAFLILPHHLKGSLQEADKKDSKFRQHVDAKFESFKERVGKLTDRTIEFRYAALAIVIVILLGSVGFIAGGHVSKEAMPDMDGDTLEARILMPQGTPLLKTEAAARKVENTIWKINDQLSSENAKELVKLTQVRFNYNPSARETGAHVATIIVDLLSAEERSITLDELTNIWKEKIGDIPGLVSLNIQEPGFGPSGIPLEIRLQGENLTTLKLAAENLSNYLEGYVAVYNILDDLRPGKPQRIFEIADGALSMGLTSDEIASQLRAAFLGDIADTQRVGLQDIDILVRQIDKERISLDDLVNQTILLPDGRYVPLEELVNIKAQREWATITRVNGKRTVTVQAEVDAKASSAQNIVNDIKLKWLNDFQMEYPEIEVSFEGQVANSAETGGSIGQGLLIGLIGIFVILSFQFGSYSESIIVMLSIPLAFIGAIWGHVFMGWYISSPSLIGAASLAGIVVNNAILLIQFINEHRAKGLSAASAAGHASRDRLRAILISSTTTIVGLLPLLAETSTQSAAIKPLAISVVFGLLTSTILILFVIPAIYVIFDDRGWIKHSDNRNSSEWNVAQQEGK
ncbi:efflux RND transporter permease subunit [Vibrio zhugei]|uniref:Efflux RND transporter permease subunit n=1 Tax=Vibrio zhugei TaxID=2479546 RepID=A0ABV7CA31_9VIBR|nr:efflux RND transporter permease subunit [Vibrio zhugei]